MSDLPVGAEQDELDEWMGDTQLAATQDYEPDLDSLTRQHIVNVLLYRIGRAQRKLGHYRALVDAQKQMAEAFFARVSPMWVRRITEAELTIDRLIRDEHQANPRIRTWKLPNGEVTYREPPVASLRVDDEDAAVAWLEANGHAKATKTVTVVRKDVLKSVGQAVPMDRPADAAPDYDWSRVVIDGEIVPGVFLVRPNTATVKATPTSRHRRSEP